MEWSSVTAATYIELISYSLVYYCCSYYCCCLFLISIYAGIDHYYRIYYYCYCYYCCWYWRWVLFCFCFLFSDLVIVRLFCCGWGCLLYCLCVLLFCLTHYYYYGYYGYCCDLLFWYLPTAHYFAFYYSYWCYGLAWSKYYHQFYPTPAWSYIPAISLPFPDTVHAIYTPSYPVIRNS